MRKAILAIASACLIVAPMSFAHSQKTASTPKTRTENRRAESRVDHRLAYLTTVLSLTTSQQEQAKKIFANAEHENSAVFANMRTEREDLRKAVDGNQPSDVIKKSSDAIGNDVAKLVANEANAHKEFRNILTPEQQTKFTKLEQERGWRMGFYDGRHFED